MIFSLVFFLLSQSMMSHAAPWDDHGYLMVSPDGHFLEYEDGTEFFWLGDTAWHLPSLDRAEVQAYLDDRKSRGFTVIQFTGDNFDIGQKNMPNYAGEHALQGTPPYSDINPNEAYWTHIDYIVDEAAKRDLYVMIVAAWGSELNTKAFTDPYNHNYKYGQFLGERYNGRKNVIHCASGEITGIMNDIGDKTFAPITDPTRVTWLRRIGQGLDSKAHAKQLITIHGNEGNPGSKKLPSDFFKDESWLDFYGNQCFKLPEYIDDMLYGDFLLTNPTKPTINIEAGYEGGSVWSSICEASNNEWGARFQAYWSVFYGGFGYTYGHDKLAAMCGPGPDNWANRNKGVADPDALNAPGGSDMRHVRSLMESRSMKTRIPDQTIITSSKGTDSGSSPDLRVAMRDTGNKWAFVYLTKGGSVTIDLSKLDDDVQARWYDPRNGVYTAIGTYPNTGTRQFTAITSGEYNDWVLVLESASHPCGDGTCVDEDCGSCPEDCLNTGEVCCSGTSFTGVCCKDSDCGSSMKCIDNRCLSPSLCEPDDCHIRVNAGGPQYIDSQGNTWSADFGFNTGGTFLTVLPISGTIDDPLYQSERWDYKESPDLSYSFPVGNGDYEVLLHFSEYSDDLYVIGGRVFDVFIEEIKVLDHLDIYSEAGKESALVKKISTQVSDDELTIRFQSHADNSKIDGIEIRTIEPCITIDEINHAITGWKNGNMGMGALLGLIKSYLDCD